MISEPAAATRVPRWAILSLPLTVAWTVGCSASTEFPAPGGPTLFREVTRELGLPGESDWPDGTYDVPEITAVGVALLDYDADGDLDLLQLQTTPPGAPEASSPNRLWRQEPDGRFSEATRTSGLGDPGRAQGVAVGDVDGDGHVDVFFANYGRDALYRNMGDGSFVEITAEAGLGGNAWSTSSVFCDYDRDGDLDLYVVHYLRNDPRMVCLEGSGRQDYCGPVKFDGLSDTLYRNDGRGRFEDVTREAGVFGGAADRGLGTVCTDLTGDDLPDIYVANDGVPNRLWVNRGAGGFVDEALQRGLAVNRYGNPEASMGVAVGDVDGDGNLDLFMTHLTGETNTLYVGGRMKVFSDRTVESGLGEGNLARTGFGCALFDADHDGDLDLAVANGRVYREPPIEGSTVSAFWRPYAEPNLFYENVDGAFRDASPASGRFTSRVEITRGLALGDLDRDGDLDIVTSNNDGTVRVFRNDAPSTGTHWLQLRLKSNGRDAIGARVRVSGGGRSFSAASIPGASYLSSGTPIAHIGLGAVEVIDGIEVLWPDGSRERFAPVGVDRESTLVQGQGEAT